MRPAHGADPADAVDRAQLARVCEDVGEETLRRYAAVFLDVLGARLDRMAQSPLGAGAADALGAAFDLRVSSAMLGAWQLAALTAEVEASLRTGVPADPRRMAELRAEAAVVSEELPRALHALNDHSASA